MEKDGEEMLQAPQRDSPAAHGADYGKAAASQQPMEDCRDAEIYLQPVEKTHTRADGHPKETVISWETHAGAGS